MYKETFVTLGEVVAVKTTEKAGKDAKGKAITLNRHLVTVLTFKKDILEFWASDRTFGGTTGSVDSAGNPISVKGAKYSAGTPVKINYDKFVAGESVTDINGEVLYNEDKSVMVHKSSGNHIIGVDVIPNDVYNSIASRV